MEQHLRHRGHSVSHHDYSADVAVIWSMLWQGRMSGNRDVWQRYRQQNRPVIVLEVGSIIRNQTWRIGINGCYQWDHFCIGDRPRQLIPLRDWRSQGDYVIIACQRTDSQQWQGPTDRNLWLRSMVAQIRQHTQRDIIVRPHPRQSISVPPGVRVSEPKALAGTYDEFDYDQLLSRAHAVINPNSGAGLRAIIQGVPVVSVAESLCHPVSITDLSQIESISCPDRSEWFGRLGWTEWQLEEVAIPLDLILTRLQSS